MGLHHTTAHLWLLVSHTHAVFLVTFGSATVATDGSGVCYFCPLDICFAVLIGAFDHAAYPRRSPRWLMLYCTVLHRRLAGAAMALVDRSGSGGPSLRSTLALHPLFAFILLRLPRHISPHLLMVSFCRWGFFYYACAVLFCFAGFDVPSLPPLRTLLLCHSPFPPPAYHFLQGLSDPASFAPRFLPVAAPCHVSHSSDMCSSAEAPTFWRPRRFALRIITRARAFASALLPRIFAPLAHAHHMAQFSLPPSPIPPLHSKGHWVVWVSTLLHGHLLHSCIGVLPHPGSCCNPSFCTLFAGLSTPTPSGMRHLEQAVATFPRSRAFLLPLLVRPTRSAKLCDYCWSTGV